MGCGKSTTWARLGRFPVHPGSVHMHAARMRGRGRPLRMPWGGPCFARVAVMWCTGHAMRDGPLGACRACGGSGCTCPRLCPGLLSCYVIKMDASAIMEPAAEIKPRCVSGVSQLKSHFTLMPPAERVWLIRWPRPRADSEATASHSTFLPTSNIDQIINSSPSIKHSEFKFF